MPSLEDLPRVLFVVGSLRSGSVNYQLARAAACELGGRARVSYLDYADVPFFNEDVEFPAPEAVRRVRAEIDAADAVWFFTPEYNYSFPAVLKNLLDWLSRPLVAGDYDTPLPLTGKPATVSGAGGRLATAGVRDHMHALLGYLKADVVDGQGEGFVLPAEVWGGAPYELPGDDRVRLSAQADALAERIAR